MTVESSLILSGAVAKGAFEAGALQVLADRGFQFRRIVGTSAGSLNGLVFAAGARVGRTREVADSLVQLWTDQARWSNVFDLRVGDAVTLRGLSSVDKITALLEEQLARWLDDPNAPRHEIELHMVVALLDGAPANSGAVAATTFEHVMSFRGEQLDDPAERKKAIAAATASSAFPIVFTPVDLGPAGLAIDGGAVNNAPIKEAVIGTNVRRVFLLEPQPPVIPPCGPLSGLDLVSRLFDILVHERLFRDLRDSHDMNAALDALEGLVLDDTLTRAQLKKVKEALHWQHARPLELIPIRPDAPLPGNVFSGFFDEQLRIGYIEAGRAAAERALADYGVRADHARRDAG